jgi:sulfur carrier protein
MRIKLNGKEQEVAARNIAELLRASNAPEVGVAVAQNGKVVRRADHESTPVAEGDEIEIIRAVQGG